MKTNDRGFSLMEVLIAATIVTVFLGALIGTENLYLRAGHSSPERAKALYLAEAELESLRFGRDESWSTNVAPMSAPSSEYIDEFVREVSFTDTDSHTKEADVSVSWNDHDATSTVSLSEVLKNLYDN